MSVSNRLPPFRNSLAGALLAAREAALGPLRPILHDAGITEQQWRVLRLLADDGPSDPSHLAGAALLHPPSLARILRDLTKRGLIGRKPDPKDGRRTIIVVTRRGSRVAENIASRAVKILDRYAKDFGKKRFSALLLDLTELTRVIGETSQRSK
jgi:homoprotocatechuate degradation regulator HpaR